jgi:type III secretion protein J
MLRRTALVLSFGLLGVLAGCNEVLFSKLSEPQANEVLAALSQARIEAAKSRIDDTSWQVEVAAAQVGPALVFLNNRGVPSQQRPSLGEVFKKDGLISSPMEERARYASAVQEEIAATLRRIDGIADARVHVAIPQNDPLSQRVVPASAAVFVKHRASLDVEMLTHQIKSMVMASVEGLDYRNISLIAFRVEGDAVAPTVVRTAGFMSAQASTLQTPALSSAGASAVDYGASALAGLAAVAATGWQLRRRRRSAPLLAAPPADVPLLPPAPSPSRSQPAPALVAAPSSQPGMFDSGPASQQR